VIGFMMPVVISWGLVAGAYDPGVYDPGRKIQGVRSRGV
jgi:hypothetical protein